MTPTPKAEALVLAVMEIVYHDCTRSEVGAVEASVEEKQR